MRLDSSQIVLLGSAACLCVRCVLMWFSVGLHSDIQPTMSSSSSQPFYSHPTIPSSMASQWKCLGGRADDEFTIKMILVRRDANIFWQAHALLATHEKIIETARHIHKQWFRWSCGHDNDVSKRRINFDVFTVRRFRKVIERTEANEEWMGKRVRECDNRKEKKMQPKINGLNISSGNFRIASKDPNKSFF